MVIRFSAIEHSIFQMKAIKSLFQFYKEVQWKGIPVGFIWLLCVILLIIKQLFDPQNILDTQEYLNEAYRLFSVDVNSSKLTNYDKLYQIHRRTPLYPLLLLGGGYTAYLGLLIQVISTIYLPFGIGKLLSTFGINKGLKPITWVLFLISYPLLSYYTVMSVPEVISSALIVMLLNFRHDLWKITFILTMLIALKPVFVVLLPLFILFNFKKTPVWVWILPVGFIFFWMYRGKELLGIKTISSITITNPYDYNRKILLLQSHSSEQVDSIYISEFNQIQKFQSTSGVAKFMSRKVKESILNNPMEYLILHLRGTIITLFDPGRYDAMIFWKWEKSAGFMGVNDGNKKQERPIKEWIYMLFFSIINGLKNVFCIVGILYCRRFIPADLYWLLISILTIYLLSIGPVGSARYLIPVFGIMTFFGGWGYVAIRNRYVN